MSIPTDLRYTKDHEWLRLDGDQAYVGITAHAQDALGDIVFVELPEIDRALSEGETFGVVESVKAVSDLFAPVAGSVVEVNEDLNDQPETINQDPYDKGWIMKIKLDDSTSAEALMDAAAYEKLLAEEAE